MGETPTPNQQGSESKRQDNNQENKPQTGGNQQGQTERQNAGNGQQGSQNDPNRKEQTQETTKESGTGNTSGAQSKL